MTHERCQVTRESLEKSGRDARHRGVRLAGPLVRAYFVLFYNTNFLLNVTLSLTILLPLLLAERIGGPVARGELGLQVAVTVYLSLLYAVVYVVNDLIDFRKDLEYRPFKVSLLTHTGSRRSATLFGLWVSVTLIAVQFRWPEVGWLLLGYAALLLAVTAVHSYFPRLKPVTIFVERGARLLAPPTFIYVMMPSFMTRVFTLSVMLAYPLLVDRAYMRYLTTKLGWQRGSRNWSRRLYASYYAAVIIGMLVFNSISSHHFAPTQLYPSAPISALMLAPILLVFYRVYERAVRWVSHLVPDGVVPDGNPTFPGERKPAACEMLMTSVLTGLLVVSA